MVEEVEESWLVSELCGHDALAITQAKTSMQMQSKEDIARM